MRNTSRPDQGTRMKETLINALATYRLTKLVIDDKITEDLRQLAYREFEKLPEKLQSQATYLLSCPWCVSIWAAGFLLLLKYKAPNLHYYLSSLLAASAITGILSERVA